MLAERTHRCPLQCPSCSNPVELEASGRELSTADWLRIIDERADMSLWQIQFSGGEPTARRDLVDLVAHARTRGLYSNLITSAVMLSRDKPEALSDAGLNHGQLSVQGASAALADRGGGFCDGHAKKLRVAVWVQELDRPLTINAVMHRQNLAQLPEIIELAVALQAERLNLAKVQ